MPKAAAPDRIDFLEYFPFDRYKVINPNQSEALSVATHSQDSLLLEAPTGTGKTAIGYTFLRGLAENTNGALYYIVPNKTLVEQVKALHPDLTVAYGRNEHPCFYYPDEEFKADEIPCALLTDCPHRVDQETGLTLIPGFKPCSYYQQRWEAKQSQIVVCTTAFYLFTQLFSHDFKRPAGLVIDEAHRIAQTVRGSLSYEITDYHLSRAVNLLEEIGAPEAVQLREFLRVMIHTIKRRPANKSTLLEPHEISELMDILRHVRPASLKASISKAIRNQQIDVKEKRETLKKIETLTFDLQRYMSSFEYSLDTPDHRALNYTYAYFEETPREGTRVNYRLVIKAYYVAPIIKKLLGERTLTMSATIGDPDIFSFESGIKAPFYALGSDFPSDNTRIFLPTDTPNLAVKARIRQEPTKVLRRIAKACKRLNSKGHRSLVVLISNKERLKFLELCSEEDVSAMSYGEGVKPKEAATKFKRGEGDVLVGTAANYGEGVDLPKGIAPVIFFLRPGYPHPDDPGTQFEERRWGNKRWQLWNWRVMMEALQVRGRNVRSSADIGVTIFVSQQFRRFLFASLPKWLQASYDGDSSFDVAIEKTINLLR